MLLSLHLGRNNKPEHWPPDLRKHSFHPAGDIVKSTEPDCDINTKCLQIALIFIQRYLQAKMIVNKRKYFVNYRRFYTGLENKVVCSVVCFPLVPASDTAGSGKWVYYRHKPPFLSGIIHVDSSSSLYSISKLICEYSE